MRVALVSWTAVAARARASVRRAAVLGADVAVLDLDGSYRAVGGEAVLRPDDLGAGRGLHGTALRRATLARGAATLAAELLPGLVAPEAVTVLLRAGVLLLDEPVELVAAAREAGWAATGRDAGPDPNDGRHPDATDLTAHGRVHGALVAVRGDARDLLDSWAATTAATWTDIDPGRRPTSTPGAHLTTVPAVPLGDLAAEPPGVLLRDPVVLLDAWTLRPEHRVERDPLAGGALTLDGARVRAVDLSALDAERPWLLDPGLGDPRARLSDHPALAELVAAEAAAWHAEPATAGAWNPDRAGFGLPVDDVLRRAGAAPGAPDLLDPAEADAALTWLTGRGTDGTLPAYLLALHGRPDLTSAFPRVPGADESAFLAWAATHAVADGAPATLVNRALAAAGTARDTSSSDRPHPRTHRTPRPPAPRGPRPTPGVNVVGFLGSELGIGESARLLTAALRASGVPYSATAVDRFAQSRATSVRIEGATDGPFDTTVLCVNSDLTPTVAPAVAGLMSRSHRVGMWYWEVEDFPPTQHGGFAVLDEVWVATEFVRRAVEPHSPVPVRTLLPPLPQRTGAPVLDRAALSLPDRPYLLFSFDFLSTAERKNPLGVLEAFRRAFGPDQGPLLVLKSINADRRPAQAEQLRLAAADRTDVLLLEQHLPAQARDALVAHCLGYVSLHRAEGLGLTMAEAMAWGRPVVATGYSGNLDFMTEENSFLVPWRPAVVPAGAPPYPAGGTWADPDLDAAAVALRVIWDRPREATARAERAARDIADLHTPEAAGRAFAARLAELEPQRRAASRRSPLAEAGSAAERAARSLVRSIRG